MCVCFTLKRRKGRKEDDVVWRLSSPRRHPHRHTHLQSLFCNRETVGVSVQNDWMRLGNKQKQKRVPERERHVLKGKEALPTRVCCCEGRTDFSFIFFLPSCCSLFQIYIPFSFLSLIFFSSPLRRRQHVQKQRRYICTHRIAAAADECVGGGYSRNQPTLLTKRVCVSLNQNGLYHSTAYRHGLAPFFFEFFPTVHSRHLAVTVECLR